MDNSLKIATLNCQGLGDPKKRRDVFNFLRDQSFSIYFIQDIHIHEKNVKFVTAEWGYKAEFSTYTTNSRGVAVLFNNNFEFKITNVLKGTDGNYLIVDIDTEGKNFTLVNIYGPNNDDPQFYTYIKNIVKNKENVIMGGDFNLVMDTGKDYFNYKHINNPNSRRVVQEMSTELDLCDIWRELNPEYLRYTWRRPNPLQQSRLDFFLISESIVGLVKNTDIRYGYRTDHSLVTLELQTNEEKHKRTSTWKMNASLLKDTTYVDQINKLIDDVICEYALSPYQREKIASIPKHEIQLNVPDDLFLDFLLMKIRSKTIEYSIIKNRKTNEEEKSLIKEINKLDKIGNRTDIEQKDLVEKEEKLEEIRGKRMEGVMLRSKARYIAEGEKNSKYFYNMEKRNFISKTMSKVVKQDNTILTKRDEIVKEVKYFYQTLYQERDTTDCQLCDMIEEIPRLTNEEAESLEGKITISEAGSVLKCMKNFKSPGSDGFTVEFFKFFWGKLGHLVVRSLNTAYGKGELSSVQKEGIITCIPKGDKPREFIKNWRPISLLNVVYKIGSACIAKRMKAVLPKLINEDQTGFMAGRYIGENLRLIYDLISFLEQNNLPGLLLNIDFEKAFDSLSWTFMFKVLDAFGFQNGIKQWIKTFYTNIKSSVLINGKLSDWFPIKRGCRQGDPISPYIFILCVEILAIMIRNNKSITGVNINNVEYKISQYADDTEFILNGDRRSFEKCIETLNEFSKISGLFVNNCKTSVIWLGSRKNSKIKFLKHLGMEWNPKKFKILGVWFTNDLVDMESINFSEKFEEIKKLIDLWTKRTLTPLGRIAILKSLVLSKLTHLWLLLPNPPGKSLEHLQKICFNFTWNNKQDRISRKTVHKSVEDGGMGLPELRTFIKALKLTWIRKLIITKHKWKHTIIQVYPFLDNLNHFGPNLGTSYPALNNFWTEVLEAYHTLFYKLEPQTENEILAEPVCFNNRIKIGNSTIKNKNLNDNEIYLIGHFFNDNGQALTFEQFIGIHTNCNINFLSYHGYKQAIKKFVRKCGSDLTSNRNEDMNICIKTLLREPKGCRALYNILIKTGDRPNCCSKWEQKLGITVQWAECFRFTKKINDIKLKWFQLRIIHRILGTNIVLNEMGLVGDKNCNLCKDKRDSIQHIFWECKITQSFLTDLIKMIKTKCKSIHLLLSESLTILGIDSNIKIDSVTYLILLLAKQFIYKCKLRNANPDISVFLRSLKLRYEIEKYNAKIDMRYSEFTAKWALYQELWVICDM